MSPPSAGLRVAFVGNPNTGKSTLFNAISGGSATVGNYPGTTVECTMAVTELPGIGSVEWVDLPGTYSLAARSPEERVVLDTLLGSGDGRAPGEAGRPVDLLVLVLDAARLQRSAYLALQVLELDLPVVVALNLVDEARTDGKELDFDRIAQALGVPVVATVARTREGVDRLLRAVATELQRRASGIAPEARPVLPSARAVDWPEALARDVAEVVEALPQPWRSPSTARDHELARWAILSSAGAGEASEGAAMAPLVDPQLQKALSQIRERAAQVGRDLDAELIGARYGAIERALGPAVRDMGAHPATADRIDRVLLHPVSGSLVFLAVMYVVFQALFAWSDPAVGAIEAAVAGLGDLVRSGFAATFSDPSTGLPAILADLVVDAVIGGVGSVLVFVPQLALLFLFVALLEDSGYLARAAHLVDRVLRLAGLPGRAFVPLLSGYACAVPAILATRTMPRRRDRFLTMAVIPLTSCSARLPVYALLIGALFPAVVPGTAIAARPLALFGMYAFSTLVTLAAATVLGRTVLADRSAPDLIELPPYRIPLLRTVLRAVWRRVKMFLREAGGVILGATLVLWALLYFPRVEPLGSMDADGVAEVHAVSEAGDRQVALEQSFAGRIGHFIEPAIAPLGFDWQIGVGLIGAFAAREVFVSTMGVVYGVGDSADENSVDLRERLREQRREDGSPRYTPLVGASLMVFFAIAFQCLSTFAVLRRETQSWRWPLLIVAYITLLAWGTSFAVYQGGRWLGWS
jgi:ferrous iron transport protein B